MADDTRICWDFDGPDKQPFMRVRSYPGETCYTVEELAVTKKGEPVWKPAPHYSCDLAECVLWIRQMMRRRFGTQTRDVDQMVRTLRELDASLIEAMGGGR